MEGSPLWLYGTHTVLTALKNPRRHVVRVVALVPWEKLPYREILVPYRTLFDVRDKAWFTRLFGAEEVHQGLCAQVLSLENPSFEDLLVMSGTTRLIALDQLTDPQNIGSLLRSAAAFGVAAVLTPTHGGPALTPALSKCACGALEHVAFLIVPNLAQALARLKKAGYWCLGMTTEGAHLFSDLPKLEKTVLVVGGESAGLRSLTRKHCDFLVRLPTVAHFPVLNAAQSATIGCYALGTQEGRT